MIDELRRVLSVRWTLGIAVAVLAAAPGAASAQQPTDSLRAEVRRLAAMVDSLSREVARLRASGQVQEAEEAGDALSRLRAAAEAAAAEAPGGPVQEAAPQEAPGRQRSLQALNPEISVNADVFAHLDQDDPGNELFHAREFEISFISNLDPYSRAKVFAAYHTPGPEITAFGEEHGHEGEEGHEGGFEIEEGYIEWVGLPHGVGLKLGRFFQQFGQLNRWHGHALAFQTRSLPHLAFIGEESLTQTGASFHWLLPLHGAGAYETTLEVTHAENEALWGEWGGASVLGHLNGFWQLSEATDLDLGLSWIDGTYQAAGIDDDRDLYGAEMAFTWRPPGRSGYRGATVRAGVMALDGLIVDQPLPDGSVPTLVDDRAIGYWASSEVRLSTNWYAGARADHTENPEDTDETAWLFAPTLTWWQSEYVRLRAEYDLLGRSFLDNHEGRLFLQVTFAMGPHKHETY